jgi:hypothetical protein
MDMKTRLEALLSRKFLAPILAVVALIFWKLFLQVIPIDIYALFIGSLFGSFLMVEGVRDIILAIEVVLGKQK